MNSLEKSLRDIHSAVFKDYKAELVDAVNGCTTLLDVGCGNNSPVQYLGSGIHKTGVDIFLPSLEQSKKRGLHDEYKQVDVLELEKTFPPHSFDCVFASELIEHLEKAEGLELLRQMELVARSCVVITTPVGFLPQPATEDNPWQLHRSGWDVDEMRKLGYRVIGFNGAKFVWNMRFLWSSLEDAPLLVRLFRKILISVTQLYTRNHPEHAFQMICIKLKGEK